MRFLPDFSKSSLDELYVRYNRREMIHPDPLEFLHQYEVLSDREVVGIIASSLAYGRVGQILTSVSTVLQAMGPSPFHFLQEASERSLKRLFGGFKHRFTTGEELIALLLGVKRITQRYGSLQMCFLTRMKEGDATVLPALTAFVEHLGWGGAGSSMFLPSPVKGSACKRLNLFLRWMVRRDEVDLGGWNEVPPSMLIVPLDVHMHRMGLAMGLTRRRQADLKTALEITDAFRTIRPEDPVRYDFSLTRLGIHPAMDR